MSDSPTADPAPEEILESVLVEWGVLRTDGEDLHRDPTIREAYEETLDPLRESWPHEEAIAAIFDVDPDRVIVAPLQQPKVIIKEGRSQWPSDAALIADAAMAQVLSEQVPEWEDTALHERGPLLAGLRIFLEVCPECEGQLEFTESPIESDPNPRGIGYLVCEDCESIVLEGERFVGA